MSNARHKWKQMGMGTYRTSILQNEKNKTLRSNPYCFSVFRTSRSWFRWSGLCRSVPRRKVTASPSRCSVVFAWQYFRLQDRNSKTCCVYVRWKGDFFVGFSGPKRWLWGKKSSFLCLYFLFRFGLGKNTFKKADVGKLSLEPILLMSFIKLTHTVEWGLGRNYTMSAVYRDWTTPASLGAQKELCCLYPPTPIIHVHYFFEGGNHICWYITFWLSYFHVHCTNTSSWAVWGGGGRVSGPWLCILLYNFPMSIFFANIARLKLFTFTREYGPFISQLEYSCLLRRVDYKTGRRGGPSK